MFCQEVEENSNLLCDLYMDPVLGLWLYYMHVSWAGYFLSLRAFLGGGETLCLIYFGVVENQLSKLVLKDFRVTF